MSMSCGVTVILLRNGEKELLQCEMRQKLIDSTIHVVANDGIHRATTKAISTHSGINEAYIYRFFNDKDDMLKEAFAYLDEEMVSAIMRFLPIMDSDEVDFRERSRRFFGKYWEFLIGNRDKCSFFIKYYYSQHYDSYPVDERAKAYQRVVDGFAPAFKKGTNVWALLNHILDVIFCNYVKVLRNEIPADESSADMVYSFVYRSIEPYFEWTEEVLPKVTMGF
ncbi:MAG: TetR/AcrR family transcriptional regulator [Ruminococcaceae bacterium]|nr:TetR/AcrR family transcriptional regulator [Oscillospiraceae bacterium]